MPRFEDPQLSPREQSLLRLAATGSTDNAIANKLGISTATVTTYWGRIRVKLGPYSRTELVAIALRKEFEEEIERLREQSAQLMTALQARQKSNEDLCRLVLEEADEAVLIFSPDARLRHCNKQALDLFGYSQEEMDGMALTSLMPERYRQDHQGHFQSFAEHRERRRMNEHAASFALHKSGEEFPVVAAISSIEMPDEVLFTCFIRRGA